MSYFSDTDWEQILSGDLRPGAGETITYLCLACLAKFELAYNQMVFCPTCQGVRHFPGDLRDGAAVRRYADVARELERRRACRCLHCATRFYYSEGERIVCPGCLQALTEEWRERV